MVKVLIMMMIVCVSGPKVVQIISLDECEGECVGFIRGKWRRS